jgi:hypothetical protein
MENIVCFIVLEDNLKILSLASVKVAPLTVILVLMLRLVPLVMSHSKSHQDNVFVLLVMLK